MIGFRIKAFCALCTVLFFSYVFEKKTGLEPFPIFSFALFDFFPLKIEAYELVASEDLRIRTDFPLNGFRSNINRWGWKLSAKDADAEKYFEVVKERYLEGIPRGEMRLQKVKINPILRRLHGQKEVVEEIPIVVTEVSK